MIFFFASELLTFFLEPRRPFFRRPIPLPVFLEPTPIFFLKRVLVLPYVFQEGTPTLLNILIFMA